MDSSSYLTVNPATGEICHYGATDTDAGDTDTAGFGFSDAIRADELPVNTSDIDYVDWQCEIFKRRPRMAAFLAVIFALPMLIGAFITYQTVYPSFVVLSPWLSPVVLFVYMVLDRTSTKRAMVIRKTPQDGILIDEQQWWRWDYWQLPEQTKFNRIIRKGSKATMTGERVAWIDARNPDALRAFRPNEIPIVFDLIAKQAGKEKPDEYVTSANIIGQESYNRSTYEYARQRPAGEALLRNAPWLIILGGSFIAVFFGATRIAEMMGVQ